MYNEHCRSTIMAGFLKDLHDAKNSDNFPWKSFIWKKIDEKQCNVQIFVSRAKIFAYFQHCDENCFASQISTFCSNENKKTKIDKL